ncbi:hypothetical protein [Capnocytophaga catalasegens]|uniref:Lipoprotein n=1 Tax=Capnocytophaga catalasegens TaxID=1004260 RepID=A0AAV5AVT2_9FLAO|nr:hypothetical protein [Capnocytophaga catalasegens]GIZ16178.1 hypothetical protein RCZ03_21780 [Capnocytophaga catalasegens]GJM51371.1 hypothetical protein RCZ15_23440 [Capnocytophaga catalasegens]GJM54184.1 hypothetical protein RCZ16_25000 [Capnocytophaga catalasegens]
MDRKSILIVTLLGLLCNSCIYYNLYFNRNYYRTETTRPRPILPRFRLAKPEPYRLKAEDQIDTTVIYIAKTKVFKDIVFLRFFGNGRVASGFLEEDSLEYNKPKRCVAGYYRMRSPTEFELQKFLAYSTTHASYEYYRGVVRGDTLFIHFDPPRKKPFSEIKINNKKGYSFYVKQKVDTLIGKPDW